VRAGVFGAAALSLTLLLSAVEQGSAQAPPSSLPLPGFVPPYEITMTVRSAGFYPLAPPRREGTTYVLRATDFRGIVMRVVVDARSGAIRAVNRIVPALQPYGSVGLASPYGPPPPYVMAPAYAPTDAAGRDPEEVRLTPPLPLPSPLSPFAANHAGAAAFDVSPPLPRPRPAELAAHDLPPAKGVDVKGAETKGVEKAAEPPTGKADTKPSASVAAPSVAPSAAATSRRPPAPQLPD
jgi:hypothetical protein